MKISRAFILSLLFVYTAVWADGVRDKLPEYCIPYTENFVSAAKVDCPPKKSETPRLSICTYNFTAITPQMEPSEYEKRLEYFAKLPGLLIDDRVRDKCGEGNVIPAFRSKESGVAAWWYWIRKRTNKNANKWGYDPDHEVSFEMLGQDICGCAIAKDGSVPSALSVYFAGYIKYSEAILGRKVEIDELHNIGDPDVRWAIAKTMFSHEAGHLIQDHQLSRKQFDMGIQLAEDHIRGAEINLYKYLSAD